MEGPSLVILREELAPFKGKKIIEVEGNSRTRIEDLKGKKILNILSWGKHLILEFTGGIALRVHFMMYGSYRINEQKERISPRLALHLKNGEINFYACSIKFLEDNISKIYDWEIDIMSDQWKEDKVYKRMKEKKDEEIGDVLLDQTIFAGVGNIIKNEVLFNLHLAPTLKTGVLNPRQLKAVIKEARLYSFKFYKWKKKFELKKHWRIYRKGKCPDCGMRSIMKKTGKLNRISFFCPACQLPKKDKGA
jgi:endonuclease VIII